jgi:hypothetical protein
MVFLCKIQILNPNYNNIIAVIKSGSTFSGEDMNNTTVISSSNENLV